MEKKWKNILYLCLAFLVWHTGIQWSGMLLPFLQWDSDPPMDMVDVGILHAFGALMNMLGAFLMGQLIDNYGIRLCFVICTISTALYYVCLGKAASFNAFLIAQIFRLGFQFDNAAEMYIATSTTETERTSALLKLGMPIGASLLIGPYIAGKLAVYTTLRTAQMLCGVTIVIGILPIVIYLLPETHDVPKSVSAKLQLHAYWPMLKNRLLLKCVCIRVALVVPLIAYELISRQYLMRQFIKYPGDAIMLFCAIGGSVLFTNFFLLRKLQQAFVNPLFVVQFALGLLSIAYLSMSFVSTYNQLMFLMIAQIIGYSMAFAEISTQLTSCVDRTELGKATGLGMSAQWLAQCFIPLAVGYFMEHSDYRWLGYGACAFTIGSAVAITKYGEFINRRMVGLPMFQY